MTSEKEYLKNKIIEFQLKIAELNHLNTDQKNNFKEKEKKLYLSIFEVLDAFENINNTIETKKDGFDKTARMLSKNISSIHKKIYRLIKSFGIIQIEFLKNKASMDYCKIVNTREDPEIENETIYSIVKNGYIFKKNKEVIRKAEVITIFNEEN